jgi:hypothetical protein
MSKFWEGFTEEKINELADEVFNKYRSSGFPYYLRLDDRERKVLYNSLSSKSWKKLVVNNHVKQTMHGLGAIWAYFPNAWEVKCGKMLSPMEVFSNDTLFKKAILKRLKYGTYLSDSGIRKSLKTASGAQGVSNFRPTAAAAVYDCFGGGDVYDMSCGYGGRLFGAIISRKVNSYTGVEPCKKTYAGLLELEQDFNYPNKPIKITMCGSEDYKPPESSIDICFTSPPYFDTEKYDTDPSQSYLKFPTYQEWMNGFIGQTLENCFTALRETGLLIYNIAETRAHPNLANDFIAIAKAKGFELKNTYYLDLSSIMANGYKYEPIFIFTKKRANNCVNPDLGDSARQISFFTPEADTAQGSLS